MTSLTELSLEPFRGDFEGLEKMAHSSHFFPYFRSVNLYSWTFKPEISLSNVRECNEILV